MGRFDAVSDLDYFDQPWRRRTAEDDLIRMANCPHEQRVSAPGLVMDGACEDCHASAAFIACQAAQRKAQAEREAQSPDDHAAEVFTRR